MSGVEIRDLPDGSRGLFATRALATDEKIILLPQRLLVTGDVARASPAVASVLRDAKADGVTESFEVLAACKPDETAIVLFLMAERIRMESTGSAAGEDNETGGEIDWGMWMRSLPTDFVTPCTVDEEMVEERLDGSYLFEFVFKVRSELLSLYQDWVVPYAFEKNSQYFPKKSMSLELFLWAHACVESRSFGLPGSARVVSKTGCTDEKSKDESETRDDLSVDSMPGDSMTVITPFADMTNHSCHHDGVNIVADSWWPEVAEEGGTAPPGFQMYVARPVSAGEELFISYEDHDNAMLLLHYGFAVSGNPHDKIPLTLDEPETSLKLVMLLGLACERKLGLQHDLTMADPLPLNLLATMRLLQLEGEDAEACTFRTNFYEPISVKNEETALNLLEGMIRQFQIPELPPRTAAAGTGLAAFEEFCDVCVQGKGAIVDSALARLERLRASLKENSVNIGAALSIPPSASDTRNSFV